ncbi:protein of unknown function UPF0118 [Methanococcus vannielii SB]|uniref:AI-2E family transporter n=1 Tax=Methanococcus vannielii (strain ATCC 35089 / DSM 1224 / JCM 13029 / OCM 148 / SB) TaxID=406327 RepID=A6USU1_METVS|nr:AI-2E family transporter [Methanococcus vannielii]ABR55563.1 protein of unknown function UPF0118 [Methanococcus vannielii SB]
MNTKEYDILKRLLMLFSVFALLYMLWPFVSIVSIAIAVAYMAKPLYNNLWPKLGRTYGAFTCLLGIVVPMILLVLLVIKDVVFFLVSLDVRIMVDFLTNVVSHFEFLQLNESDISKIVSELWKLSKPILDSIASQISAIPSLMMKLLLLFFLTFYFLKDGYKIKDIFLSYVPEDRKEHATLVIREVHAAFKILFIGNAVTSLCVGIISIIGYSLMGVPNSITLGALSGILNILPVVGGWTIYFPLTIYYLLIGDITKSILILLFGIIFLSLAPDFAIRPKIVAKSSDLHPVLVLIAFLVGPLAFGISGLAIGPIIVGTVYAVHKARQKILEMGG